MAGGSIAPGSEPGGVAPVLDDSLVYQTPDWAYRL
jgi:hypothetical protein